jgi:GH18 family chitinase
MSKKILIIGIILATCAPLGVFAATSAAKTPFYYGVWLPYWQGQNGAANISQNLDKLDEVSPFSYEIGSGGALIDDLNIDNGSWAPWFSAVKEDNIKILPTIADFDPNAIYNLLSNTKSRQVEETRIASLVKTQGFDGIDIDFESMSSQTRPYYSLFIEGLAERLHPVGKELTCTVEARTPPVDLYETVTPDITSIPYPENYSVLNQYCDEVRVMAYDQDTIDVGLNATKGNGQLYAPVADPAWVAQVLSDTLPYISAKKIMLGVPTYGYEYEVSWNSGVTTYQRIRAFDYMDAMDRADSMGIEPTRDNGDELSFTYTSSTYIQAAPILVTDVISTEPLVLDAQQVSASTSTTAGTTPLTPMTTFFVTFPDATSINDEIKLAKADGLRGVMLFKADGDIDPLTWQDMD